MNWKENHRTPEGTIIIAGGEHDFVHEYKFENGHVMRRYLRPDGSLHDDGSSEWTELSQVEIASYYFQDARGFREWLAEYGFTKEVCEEIRQRDLDSRRRRPSSRRRR